MIDFAALRDLHIWRVRNFPDADADQQLLGMIEELGELAHANLKQKQGIREKSAADEQDAIGDMLIYCQGYCAYRGWNMAQIFERTAEQVMQRDWVKNPKDGS